MLTATGAFDLSTLSIIAATFLLAGTVKGVVGLGLPTISLGLLTVAFDLTTAMALLLVPSFVTNIWQAAIGGNGLALLRRLWPFLGLATATVWLGAMALTRVDLDLLSGLLGVLVAAYAVLNMAGVRPVISARNETWAGPVFGTVNGVLTGMTGSFLIPGVLFLQALGLDRNQLVQAMGILFLVSTVALAIALQNAALLSVDLGVTSVAALFPALAGMVVGQRVRKRLSEDVFRRVFFIAILLLGFYIIASAAFS